MVAAVILAVHGAALYALCFGPEQRSRVAQSPLSVYFIERPQIPSEPPSLQIPVAQVRIELHEAPHLVVELPPEPSERAITTPAQVAPPPPPASEDRRTPKFVAAVEYVQQPAPRYPPQSRRLREQGLVVLRVLIDEAGNACSIDVETSSGHPRLDAAAREAIQHATFRPYMEDGAPRRALVLIPIEFSLNRSAA
jgi:periplasmic protein TonB